ncbi:glutamate receptor-interacting protein 1 isoform X2 [Anabrus simplex]|uniref:glutamate receptor-interacting protein 1 isoform X2 n=1 Tax=Anabrus simplex TaxID=316456 RepID=UPI0035A3C459
MTMFSSLKLPNLRGRAKNSNAASQQDLTSSASLSGGVTSKPPRTPLPTRRRGSKCGVDRALCPSIGALRPGSAAQRSDALCPGDRITAVNGIRTANLRHDELVNLLRNVQGRAVLDVEYPLPDIPEPSATICTRVYQVRIEREAGSLGFTLRGGTHPDPILSRPLVVTHVRPGGPADREGSIQPGDRLVSVDGASLLGVTLADAQTLLHRHEERSATLGIEYDVSVLETVRQASGPLLVEVALPPGKDLGITLTTADSSSVDCGSVVLIESVRPTSIAERCGALHAGDQVLAVGDTRLDCSPGVTAAEVLQLQRQAQGGTLMLEILPRAHINCGWRLSDNSARNRGLLGPKLHPPSPSPSPSGFSTLNSRRRARFIRTKGDVPHDSGPVSGSSCLGVCHMETVMVTLQADQHGYGLSVQEAAPGEQSAVLVNGVEIGSPADRCGCIQSGDRILAVNNHSVALDQLTAADVTRILQDSSDGSRVSLQLEFDVADSVVPSSGVFNVKLAKRGNGLGITITASKNRLPGEPLLISDIRRGSVAHRTGSLQPGDRLLAIDSVRLDQCSLEDTQQILQSSGDIVTLRVQKDDTFSDVPDSKSVVYTVELARHGGPLGITIAGSEEPFEPITISGLTNGGLAQQTGALHVGDRLLAINGESLRGKPLSEAIALLQNSGDIVTLKIARSVARNLDAEQRLQEDHGLSAGQFGPALPSVDSAVESWDSSPMGHTPPATQPSTELYQAESATVKRRHKVGLGGDNQLSHWDGLSQSSHSVDSGQSGIFSEEDKLPWDKNEEADLDSAETEARKQSQTISHDQEVLQPGTDSELCYSPPASPLPLPHYLRCNGSLQRRPSHTDNKHSNNNFYDDGCGSFMNLASPSSSNPSELYQVTLFKDPVYEDFGFSVSDGLYERGVYINRIRKGGPADLSGTLRPYDRILQVNDTRTHDFDCCLTVPLIASAGEKLELTVARNPYLASSDIKDGNGVLPWVEEEEGLSCSQSLYPSSGTVTKTL